jgi:hypothetical protein
LVIKINKSIMKNIFLKSALAIATGSFLLLGSGCKKLEDFGDTNENPLGSTAPITAALLTNVESQLGALAQSVRPALYVQYLAETQYTEVSLYQEPKLDFAGTYSGPLYDLQSIIDRNSGPDAVKYAPSGSNANQIAVATILKTYIIWTITDRWGDVPYSEALKGAANFFPKYDPQEEIYPQMLAELKSAVTMFDGGLAVKGDVLYDGNETQWKKFANTLRMQIAQRMSNKAPTTAAAEFALAATDPGGIITSNADNLVSNYPGGSAYRHPWYDLYDGRTDYALSKTLGDILSNMGDGRRAAYGTGGATFPYGLTRAQATSLPTSYAKVLADSKRTDNAPAVISSAAYSLLTLAEGMERGWVPGGTAGYASAADAYNAGITASFEQWGIAGAAVYIVSPQANYATGTGGGTGVGVNTFGSIPATSNAVTANALERIYLQKYLALFPDGIQAWSEWRRTGIPAIKPTTNAINSPGFQIPTRYVYGQAEYSLSPDQLAEAVARLPLGDVMNEFVWWDRP